MASDTPAHFSDNSHVVAHAPAEKMMPTDNMQGLAHNDAYSKLVHELQNTPELRSFFKQSQADKSKLTGSEGLGNLELFDNSAPTKAGAKPPVDHGGSAKGDKTGASGAKDNDQLSGVEQLLGSDHSRDYKPKANSQKGGVEELLGSDHSRDYKPKANSQKSGVEELLGSDHSRDYTPKTDSQKDGAHQLVKPYQFIENETRTVPGK
jgi:hypothetical protein